MNGEVFLTLTLNGLALSAVLFLLASGVTLIYGLLDVINFAQGAFFMVGAYICAALTSTGMPLWLAVLIALVVGAGSGFLIEKFLIRRMYGRLLEQFLLTLGISILIGEVLRIIAGPNFVAAGSLGALNDSVSVFGINLQAYRFVLVGAGIAVFLLMYFALKKTRVGLIVRAGIEDRSMVQALGINVKASFTLVFVIGSALAFLAGGVAAPYYGGASLSLGEEHVVLAFIVAVVGGLGSFSGSAIAAVAIALLSSYASYFWAPGGALVPALLMALILIFRPQGIVQAAKARV